MTILKKIISVFTASALGFCAASASAINAGAVVTVTDGVFQYAYINDTWQLYSYSGSDTEVTLPQTFAGEPVTAVYSHCFADSNIVSADIPEGYESIGEYAFYNCGSLRDVSLPSTISEIKQSAFSYSGIVSADLSGTHIDKISSYLFDGCRSLEHVLLPDSTENIGDHAFAGSSISEIDIPEGVVSLESKAFYETGSLDSVRLPNSLESIENSCFENSALSRIELPESLKTIGTNAFSSCTSLSELYIPDSVSSIGAYALFPMSVQSTIHVTCFKDSYADTYCYENFVLNETAYEKIRGDANLDGVVDINDATAIQRYLARMDELSRPAEILAEIDRDGYVTINDATLIQMYIAQYDVSAYFE